MPSYPPLLYLTNHFPEVALAASVPPILNPLPISPTNPPGLEITLTLASHGCRILGTYHNTPPTRLSELLADKFSAVEIDIRSPAPAVSSIISSLQEKYPGIPVDILVNNAGLAVLGPLSTLSGDSMAVVFNANTIFPALLTQSLLPFFNKEGRGRIINISSEASHLGRANTTAYSASKAALESMTRTWAKELGQEYNGMTVNALALGMMETHLFEELPKERQTFWREKAKEMPVAPRIGQGNDVGPVVAFLASDAARWVSGQVISVSGGNMMVV
jgi:3-oxoacyl-[acyl-carrier protein] reductase